MAKRRPSGDGMVRKRDDGRWEGRIVVGHKNNGEPIYRYVLAKGQNYHDVSRTNGVWSTSTVLRILADERYTGMYIVGKRRVVEIGSTHIRQKDESEWIKIPDHHTPLISAALFECATSNIHKFKLSNRQARNYLLCGKVFCGCCDHAMNISNGRHYKCRRSAKLSDMPCNSLSIPIKELEQIVFDTINAQAKCLFGVENINPDTKANSLSQEEHEKKLRFLQDSKRELYEQFILGEISEDTYKAEKAELDIQLSYERNVSEVISSQAKSEREEHEKALRQKKIADELNDAGTLTKSLVDLLIKRVYVFPDNRIELEYNPQTFF